jgi:predicted  nucleic acid-binding Zn-ribbon protein
MMKTLRPLYDLQEIDISLDGRNNRLFEIQRILGNESPLSIFRAEVGALVKSATEMRTRQKEIEDSIDSLSTRISSSEEILYSGTITNPRALQDLQAEIAQLSRQQNDSENTLLVSMEELLPVETELNKAHKSLDTAEKIWTEEQERIGIEKQQLETEILALREERESRAGNISNLILPLYENVRRTHSGKGVALVQNGICESCRIALPTSQIHALRAAIKPERCPNCGLILLVE